MKKHTLIKLFALILLVEVSNCRQITKCEFIRTLVKQNVVNVYEHLCASFGDKEVLETSQNTYEGRGFGIYSIHRNWCDFGEKNCGIPCSQLTDDNIYDDVACAKVIFTKEGPSAWRLPKTECAVNTAELVGRCILHSN